MSRIVTPPDLKQCLGLAGMVAALTVGVVAQSIPPDRLVFAEAHQLHLVLPASHGSVIGLRSLPKELNAGEYSPDYARRMLVPAMGGSIAVGDFDSDGHPDLYVARPEGPNVLFRNNGDGTFEDVSAKAKVPGPSGSLFATFGDYDRSGRQSLFVTGAGGVVLYHNNRNGTFSDATKTAGLWSNLGELCTRAVLADVDGDGFPDLLVTIYTDLNRPPGKSVFVFPNDFAGVVSRLYRNNGDGTFTNITIAAGLAENPGRARSAVFADFNNDRQPDLLILRDDKPPALHLNRGGAKFEDATWVAGDALTQHAFFDAMVADLNRDGKPDLVLWSSMSFGVLLNRGNATFERAESIPLLAPLSSPFGFHGTVADLDGNGFDDVLTVDNDGRSHVFVNRAGIFTEVPFFLSSRSEKGRSDLAKAERSTHALGSIIPLRLENSVDLSLLALHRESHISIFTRLTNFEVK